MTKKKVDINNPNDEVKKKAPLESNIFGLQQARSPAPKEAQQVKSKKQSETVGAPSSKAQKFENLRSSLDTHNYEATVV